MYLNEESCEDMMDLPPRTSPLEGSHNLLHCAYHSILGLAWSDGTHVYVSDIEVTTESVPIHERQRVLMGRFENVRHVAWNRTAVEAYLAVQLASKVCVYRVTGDLHQKAHVEGSKKWLLAREISAGLPLCQGLLWNPQIDSLCVLFEQRAIVYSYDADKKMKFALPKILHEITATGSKISCGGWSKDGQHLLVCDGPRVTLYSWSSLQKVADKISHYKVSEISLGKPPDTVSVCAVEPCHDRSFLCSLETTADPGSAATSSLCEVSISREGELAPLREFSTRLYDLPSPNLLTHLQDDVVCASNNTNHLNILRLSNSRGLSNIHNMKLDVDVVVHGVHMISPGLMLLLVCRSSQWSLELRKISHLKGNVSQVGDVPQVPPSLHHHPRGVAGVGRGSISSLSTTPHQTTPGVGKHNPPTPNLPPYPVLPGTRLEDADISKDVALLSKSIQMLSNVDTNASGDSSSHTVEMISGGKPEADGKGTKRGKERVKRYPGIDDAQCVHLHHPAVGVKTFLLDDGRLRYGVVVQAFNLWTLTLQMTDGNYCYLGDSSEGYIPLTFQAGSTVHIGGDSLPAPPTPQSPTPSTHSMLNKPVNLFR